MTRNTKLHKIKNVKVGNNIIDIFFRDLTVLELKFLDNVKNPTTRLEFAARTSITNCDPSLVDISVLFQIGEKALIYSVECISDSTDFELTIKDLRNSVMNDPAFTAIAKIIKVLPTESINELMNQTYKDLLELSCFCEIFSGQKEWNIGDIPNKRKGMSLVNPNDLPDDTLSQLQANIANLNNTMGPNPRITK